MANILNLKLVFLYIATSCAKWGPDVICGKQCTSQRVHKIVTVEESTNKSNETKASRLPVRLTNFWRHVGGTHCRPTTFWRHVRGKHCRLPVRLTNFWPHVGGKHCTCLVSEDTSFWGHVAGKQSIGLVRLTYFWRHVGGKDWSRLVHPTQILLVYNLVRGLLSQISPKLHLMEIGNFTWRSDRETCRYTIVWLWTPLYSPHA